MRCMKPLLVALVLLVTLVVTGCTSGSSPEANPSATPSAEGVSPSPAIAIDELQGKILFTRAGYNYGDETVFTADADGTNERRITGVGMTCCPRWSPDGKHILMAASAPDGRLTTQIVDPDGSHLRTVPLPPGTLNLECAQALSLVTGRLACVGWSDTKAGLNGVYTVRASDGGGVVQLTHCSEECRVFDFSPDGSEIFFFRAVEGFPGIGDQPGGSLFVISAGGTDLHRITHADTPVEVTGNSGGRLSPDGQQIVFTSSGAIWAIHPDGSGLMKVFEDAQGGLAITPTWSPDNQFILFGLDPPGSLATIDAPSPNGLYVIRADGTDLTPILVSDDWKRNPDWVAAR
jgi:tricorn protease-like protein